MARSPLLLLLVFIVVSWPEWTPAHDIPNARVDRSIQVTLTPGRLAIEYEVNLSELTLTRDLRDLIGSLPEGDRDEWFQRYGRETAPLNAKGMLVSIDGRPLPLEASGFDLVIEDHPRYTFRFEAAIPPRGHLKVHDANFVSSEGSSRLALRGRKGVSLHGDPLPTDVQLILIQPLWLMSDLEERRSKEADCDFETRDLEITRSEHSRPVPSVPVPRTESVARSKPISARGPATDRLSRLLDRSSALSVAGLILIAFGLGAAHAVQPGHGKTLVAATVVAEQGSWLRGVLLAVITTTTHTGSVLIVALGLWLTRSSRYETIHSALTFCAGFAIAAIGFWRLGRQFAGYDEHAEEGHPAGGTRNLVSVGVAGGLVPCWDAVALILMAEAVGRLGTGVVLLVAFGTGMAAVLIVVGWAAARCRQLFTDPDREGRAERWLRMAGSLVLCMMGLYLLRIA